MASHGRHEGKPTYRNAISDGLIMFYLLFLSYTLFPSERFYSFNFWVIERLLPVIRWSEALHTWLYLFVIVILFILLPLLLFILIIIRFIRQRERRILVVMALWCLVILFISIIRLNEPFLIPVGY